MNRNSPLTPSLEDYLETIYLFHKGAQRVRVRDISKQRNVKAASVTPALKRLAEMGFLQYEQRETIQLTEAGKVAARRIYARHQLLFQFFHNVLGMDKVSAQNEACGLEHALSDEGMSRFVGFFEAISTHPNNIETVLDTLKERLFGNFPTLSTRPNNSDGRTAETKDNNNYNQPLLALADNTEAVVIKLKAKGQMRQNLIDTGLVPNVMLRKISTDTLQNQICIELHHHNVTISTEQAAAVIVHLRDGQTPNASDDQGPS